MKCLPLTEWIEFGLTQGGAKGLCQENSAYPENPLRADWHCSQSSQLGLSRTAQSGEFHTLMLCSTEAHMNT